MARASWNMNYEKILVDILHEHNHVKYRGQNGWAPEGWRSMTQMFNEKCPLAKFTKAQIQEKEKELKANYKVLKEARKQSGVGWSEAMGMIIAEPPIWANIIVSNPKVKKFQSRPFPLYNQLSALYDGSCATGDLNFTSTQQHTSSRQQLHIQAEVEAEAMSSFRIDDDLRVNPDLNQFSSNLHGLASSSTRVEIGGHDRTPASSEQRAESHGRKRKQSQIAGVLEEYLDYKRQHNDKLLDVVKQIDQQVEGCNKKEEYCIGKCVRVLESMEELTEEEMAAAMGVIKCEEIREIFLNSQRPRVRLLWLRNEIDKQMSTNLNIFRCPPSL